MGDEIEEVGYISRVSEIGENLFEIIHGWNGSYEKGFLKLEVALVRWDFFVDSLSLKRNFEGNKGWGTVNNLRIEYKEKNA